GHEDQNHLGGDGAYFLARTLDGLAATPPPAPPPPPPSGLPPLFQPLLSMVAQGEPLGVTHMAPGRRRDRIPRIQVSSSLLASAGRASAARRDLLLGGLRSEARAGDLHEVGAVGQPVEGS